MAEQILVLFALRAAEIALLALGFATIFRTTGVFHLPFAPLYTVTVYLMVIALNHAFPLALAIVLGIVGASVLGVLTHTLFYEPVLRRHGGLLTLLITAFGVYVVYQAALSLPLGFQPLPLSSLLPTGPRVSLGAIALGRVDVFKFVIEAFAVAGVVLLLKFTKLGTLIRAVGADESLARALGIDGYTVRSLAVGLGTFAAAIAAVLAAWSNGVVDLSVGLPAALAATVAAFLGGTDSLLGPVLGGVALAFVEVVVSQVLSNTWADAIVYSILIGVILVRPKGLLQAARQP